MLPLVALLVIEVALATSGTVTSVLNADIALLAVTTGHAALTAAFWQMRTRNDTSALLYGIALVLVLAHIGIRIPVYDQLYAAATPALGIPFAFAVYVMSPMVALTAAIVPRRRGA